MQTFMKCSMGMYLAVPQNRKPHKTEAFPKLPAELGALSTDAPPRFERKFAITTLHKQQIDWHLRNNPGLFRPLYHPRIVNNIYLDTEDRQFFRHNIEGVASRLKVRIRWYGSPVEALEDPRLELKIKSGLAGWKLSYPLRSMLLEEALDRDWLLKYLRSSALPAPLFNFVKTLKPTLLNRYHRSYQRSVCKAFRMTLDTNLQYTRAQRGPHKQLRFITDPELKVLELKYDTRDDSRAAAITNAFPFRLSRNSKYVRGLMLVESPAGLPHLSLLKCPARTVGYVQDQQGEQASTAERISHPHSAHRSRKSRREQARGLAD